MPWKICLIILVLNIIFSHLSVQATEILIYCPQDLIKRDENYHNVFCLKTIKLAHIKLKWLQQFWFKCVLFVWETQMHVESFKVREEPTKNYSFSGHA